MADTNKIKGSQEPAGQKNLDYVVVGDVAIIVVESPMETMGGPLLRSPLSMTAENAAASEQLVRTMSKAVRHFSAFQKPSFH